MKERAKRRALRKGIEFPGRSKGEKASFKRARDHNKWQVVKVMVEGITTFKI